MNRWLRNPRSIRSPFLSGARSRQQSGRWRSLSNRLRPEHPQRCYLQSRTSGEPPVWGEPREHRGRDNTRSWCRDRRACPGSWRSWRWGRRCRTTRPCKPRSLQHIRTVLASNLQMMTLWWAVFVNKLKIMNFQNSEMPRLTIFIGLIVWARYFQFNN